MAIITQETQAAAVVNNIIAMCAQLNGVAASIASISALWTNLSVANKINAFPTAPMSTNGTLGVADGTPTVANPIDVRVSPGSDISRAISPNNIASMLTFIQGVQSAINGSAVSINGAAAQLQALAL